MSRLRVFLPVGRALAPADYLIGADSIAALSGLDGMRIALLLSPTVARNGMIHERLERALHRKVSRFVVLPSGEPVLTALEPALDEVASFRPDWICAIGGGAVLDAAKIVWARYEHPWADLELLTRPQALGRLRGKARFVAAPTTAGSGSEASSTATFQAAEGARKSFLVSHELLPDLVILDPALCREVPAGVFLRAGLDALAHAVEGVGSRHANPMLDLQAESAARCLIADLEAAAADPQDDEGRARIMAAASLAGAVQNVAIPGIGHAMAHQLAAEGVPHALSTGALLAAALAENTAADSVLRARYDRFGAALGVGNADGLISAIETLARRTGVQKAFIEAAAAVDVNASEFVEGVTSDPCAEANRLPVTDALVRTIFERVAS